MRRHIIPNKLYYSYYSVFLAGMCFLAIVYGTFLLGIKEVMTFPLLMNGITALVGLFVLVSNVSLILHEKFRPSKLMGLAIIIVSILLAVATIYIPYRFVEYLTYYGNVMLFGYLIMSYLAVKRTPCFNTDFVIILGCSISKNGHLLPLLKGRVNKAIRFAWDQERATGKPALYVPSGGQGSNEIMSEGSAMEFYLMSHGAEEDEVFPEKQSRNTYENMVFSKKVIDEIDPNAVVSYCTTNFHVFRSGILAQKAGIDAQGISSGTKWYFWPNALIREFVGFLSLFSIYHIVLCAAIVGISFII